MSKAANRLVVPVPDVVVGAFLGLAGHHRERRLAAGQRLDLGLFVHAIHHRGVGRVQVEPDDVVDLLHKQRVVGQFEVLAAMWLQLKGFPDPPDGGLGQPAALGHRFARPVRGVGGDGLQRRHHHVLDLLGGHRRGAARPRVVDQPVAARLDEPAPPLAHRGLRHPLAGGHFLVGQPLGAAQHDPRPQRQRLGGLAPARPPGQRLTLLLGQHQLSLRSPACRHKRIISPRNLIRPATAPATTSNINVTNFWRMTLAVLSIRRRCRSKRLNCRHNDVGQDPDGCPVPLLDVEGPVDTSSPCATSWYSQANASSLSGRSQRRGESGFGQR